MTIFPDCVYPFACLLWSVMGVGLLCSFFMHGYYRYVKMGYGDQIHKMFILLCSSTLAVIFPSPRFLT